MRITPIILLVVVGITSCGTSEHGSEKRDLIQFKTTPVQSPSLLVKPTLKYSPESEQMTLDLTLKNLDGKSITIEEIRVNNLAGLPSTVQSATSEKFIIRSSRDTTSQAIFRHINDKKLFHQTGLPGLIDSLYSISVFYSIEGIADKRVVNLASSVAEEDYRVYRKNYDVPVQLYVMNTANGFAEKQKQFLVRHSKANPSPFVYITDQELAMSGLNFRIRSFHRGDSVYAEIFAVNHSEMTVKIDTSEIEIISPDVSAADVPSTRSIEKVTGSRYDVTTLAKGDRVILNIRKKVKRAPEGLSISFARSFFLPNGQPLFSDDIMLAPSTGGSFQAGQ